MSVFAALIPEYTISSLYFSICLNLLLLSLDDVAQSLMAIKQCEKSIYAIIFVFVVFFLFLTPESIHFPLNCPNFSKKKLFFSSAFIPFCWAKKTFLRLKMS